MGVMHELAELNRSGDTKTLWNPDNPDEVAIAEEAFDSFIAKGFSIFRVDSEGGKGTRMTKFDPRAAKMIAVPRVVGG